VRAAPEVPRELAGLVHRAMAVQPELRFATATEMRLALTRMMSGSPVAMAPIALRAAPGPSPIATGVQAVKPQASPPRAAMESREPEPRQRTVQAAPLPMALGALPCVAAMPVHPAEMPSHRRRTPVLLVAVIALLLGAAIVCILVGVGVITFPAPEPNLATVVTPPPSDTDAALAPAPVVTTSKPSDVPTLGPTHAPPPGPPPPPRPAPSGHTAPSASTRDAEAPPPPFVFPSALPTIPGVLSLPSGFPTSIPGLMFPGWPKQPGPAPSASAQPGY
jgi:hypothetical protein